MAVIGVLGHTDHGKSTLLERMTGVNPMHLPEEKKRGLTIQLGFAFLNVDEGEIPKEVRQEIGGRIMESGKFRISFIDVPGHEMFLRNMLRGVLNVNAGILVVSADDGVMPGTVEHLRASLYAPTDLGLIAISKIDLAGEERIEEVKAEVAKLVKGTYWENARVIPYSSATGEGLDDLRKAIIELAVRVEAGNVPRQIAGKPRQIAGKPRHTAGEPRHTAGKPLPFSYYFVDRAFSVKGYGSVVTGTLRGRSVSVGDELYLYPRGLKVKVRSAEQGGIELKTAVPNFRTALNLSGARKEDISVGDLLLSAQEEVKPKGYLAVLKEPTGSLRTHRPFSETLSGIREKLNLIVGSRLVEIEGILLREIQDGVYIAVIHADFQVPIPFGEPIVIYRTSVRTVAIGGMIMPLNFPLPSSKRRTAEVLQKAGDLAREHIAGAQKDSDVVSPPLTIAYYHLTELMTKGWTEKNPHRRISLFTDEEFGAGFRLLEERLPEEAFGRDENVLYLMDRLAEEIRGIKERILKQKDASPEKVSFALLSLLPKDAILLSLSPEKLDKIMAELSLKHRDGTVFIPMEAGLGVEQENIKARILSRFREGLEGYPTLPVLRRDFPTAKNLIAYLMKRGDIVHIGQGVLVTGRDFESWGTKVMEYLREKGSITTQEAKNLLGISRKYLIPFLELLDSARITERQEEVRKPAGRFHQAEKILREIAGRGE